MLTLLTPFILGIVVQISAIISAIAAAPEDDNSVKAGISRAEFAYRLDYAVFAPSVLILVSSALLNKDRLDADVVSVIVASGVLILLAGQALLHISTPTSYAVRTRQLLHVSPLNATILAANVALGIVTAMTATPEQPDTPDKTAERYMSAVMLLPTEVVPDASECSSQSI